MSSFFEGKIEQLIGLKQMGLPVFSPIFTRQILKDIAHLAWELRGFQMSPSIEYKNASSFVILTAQQITELLSHPQSVSP